MSATDLFLLLTLFLIIGAMLLRKNRPMVTSFPEIKSAVRRASELNRSVYFIPGSRDIDNIQTVSALSMLKIVALYCAESDVKLIVPVSKSMVLERARSICETAYQEAGFPDRWSPSQVSYSTDDPLGFVAHVDGMISREKPAVCFMFGFFAGESLLLAESAYSVSEIRIAGTAVPSQLPFFVASCDATLIGEEFFASSATLSGDSGDLAMLRGLDAGKYIAIGIVVLFSVFLLVAYYVDQNLYESLYSYSSDVFHWGTK
jgi:hypothetical protein